MKNKNTLRIALVLLILLGAVAIGYFALNRSASDDPSRAPGTAKHGNNEINPGGTVNRNMSGKPEAIEDPEIIKDSTLTRELQKEKIVELGQIYVKGDVAYGAIVVKEMASKNQAQKVAEKYLDKMKKRYKNMKINVQVVRDGENLVNLTYGF